MEAGDHAVTKTQSLTAKLKHKLQSGADRIKNNNRDSSSSPRSDGGDHSPRDSPRGGGDPAVADTLEVETRGGPGGRQVVDVIEMSALRSSHHRGHNGEVAEDTEGWEVNNHESRSDRGGSSGSSSLVFSKKHGVSKGQTSSSSSLSSSSNKKSASSSHSKQSLFSSSDRGDAAPSSNGKTPRDSQRPAFSRETSEDKEVSRPLLSTQSSSSSFHTSSSHTPHSLSLDAPLCSEEITSSSPSSFSHSKTEDVKRRSGGKGHANNNQVNRNSYSTDL